MANKIGPVQQKIILLLLAGIALSLSRSPRKQLKIIRGIGEEWKEIDQRALTRAIAGLYQNRLIEEREHSDGTTTIVLNTAGKREALRYNLNKIQIATPARWDKKWRIVLFDIPEREKKLRDTFRWHLKQLKFYEFQKSAFIFPYDCRKELDYIIEFYRARKYIRLVTAESVDNGLHMRKIFDL